MDFLCLKLEDNLLQILYFYLIINIQIKYFSQSLLLRLGYKVKDEQYFQFKMLIPDIFYEIHQELIKQFLESGTCKYLNKISDMLIRGLDNIYYYSLFQLNIENSTQSELSFYVFIKINEEQPNSIFINQQQQIIGYTTSFLKYIQQKNINFTFKSLYLQELSKIIILNKYHIGQKYIKGYLKQDQLEITLEIIERKNFVELLILDENIDYLLNQEIFSQEPSQQCSLMFRVQKNQINDNQESLVLIPNQLFIDELNSPLSLEKRDKPSQELIENNIKQQESIKKCSNINSQSILDKQKKSKINQKGQQDNINNDQASSKFSRGFLDIDR